jgi:hypothetical protein
MVSLPVTFGGFRIILRGFRIMERATGYTCGERRETKGSDAVIAKKSRGDRTA